MRAAHDEEEEEEEETPLTAMRSTQSTGTAVFQVAMGNCAEEHGRAWAGHWFTFSGVADEDDPSRLDHGQEGSFGWWGGVDDDTGSGFPGFRL